MDDIVKAQMINVRDLETRRNGPTAELTTLRGDVYGDYAFLDRRRKTLSDWFRQGSAALLGVLLLFGGRNLAYGNFTEGTVSRVDAESEASLVLREGVSVFHGEDQKRIADALPNIFHISISQKGAADTVDSRAFLRGKGYSPGFGKNLRHQIVFAVANGPNPNINRGTFDLDGSITTIQKSESDVNRNLLSGRINSEIVNRQSTGEFVFKGFLADKSRYFLNSFHALVGLPQRPSESRNGNSGERGNRSFERVKQLADLNQNEWRKVIAGAVFLAGLGFIAYLTRRA